MSSLLSTRPALRLRKFSLAALFLLTPLFFFGQTLTGLWIGSTSNDSSTVRKDQSFEIALTEYRGKVYGYSRSEFIVNDTLYYIVKRVKGTIDGNKCEVTDDEIVSYNFRGKLDKGIKVTSTFIRNETDSTWSLAGTWKTNATKKFYAVTGKVDLSEEKDLNASKIFPHLEELNLADKVAFYKERKETPAIVRVVKPEREPSMVPKEPLSADLKPGAEPVVTIREKKRTDTDPTIAEAITKANTPVIETPVMEEPIAENANKVRKPGAELPKSGTNEVEPTSVALKTNPAEKKRVVNENPSVILTNANKTETLPTETNTDKTVAKSNKETTAPVTAKNKTEIKPVVQNNTKPVLKNNDTNPAITKQPTIKPAEVQKTETVKVATADEEKSIAAVKPSIAVASTEKKDVSSAPSTVTVKPDITLKAAVVEGRKSEFTQEVNFKSDSLQISIYDNGVVDGDTVSVFMNGEVIMAKQGLRSSAIKKTIYLTPGKDDEFTLVLFADNLGLYPPNTGLLVVRDGNDIYNLRFSADYQKNAGVVFRRKK